MWIGMSGIMLEKHLLVNMSTCPSCGKSFVGQLRHIRLGLDEPPVLVKCACTSGQEELDLAMSFSESRSCIGYPGDSAGQRDQREMDFKYTICPAMVANTTMEHEIMIEPHISRRIYLSVKARSQAWTEFGRAHQPTQTHLIPDLLDSRTQRNPW